MRRLIATPFVLLVACLEHEPPRADGTSTQAAPSDAALCREHGVLEAVCTKCNPSLVPVFKAKGDWCEEHGFPESFCPICHPELGGRPASDVTSDADGPADGTRVRFRSKETARLAGLELVKAVERPTAREVVATARVVYDATRVAQINPRMPGVVRALRADVGITVRRGAPLAVIESAGVGAEQGRLQSARMRLKVAETNYARAESLGADGITAERDVLAARREQEDARAEVRTAEASLGMVGASADGGAEYTLTAPINGVVTQRRATIGRLVDVTDMVFEIVDPSTMWVELDVPESELSLVTVGQPVTVTFDGIPGRAFVGALSYVAPSVDPRTRTAIARLPLVNSDGALRENVFGRAHIRVTDPRASVLVPRSAVQRARSVSLVFVRVADDAFEARRVTLQPGSGDLLGVSGRVQAGDEVVADGSFLLKTETLKESIGAGCCEVD
ncbi:MAG: efflux RND transporter periplasmic adaptor subunit [Deltaproteobacteria bacterium]|nr:efflux RND transporter periplasmic adaptor subunit [Deltaproteobacteria bacterium]